MQSDLVSIMMPAYNTEKYIGEAIESVLAQSYPHWELIIVNDGSTDRTAEIATQYTDLRIKVFHQVNSGESAARNAALKQMKGEYVAFLDADDLFLPSHLETAIGFLQAHPEYNCVYTDGYYINEKCERLMLLSSRRRGPFEGDIFEEVVRASDVFGPPVCIVLRHDMIIGRRLEFDPGIVIGPDWDFFIRCCEVTQFGYVDQVTCLYRMHQTNISIRTNSRQRALHLAKCREKTIKLDRFSACSVETRTFVFYDLLINLLASVPERQTAITQWPEFNAIPTSKRAKLFRLMASKAILDGMKHDEIENWLQISQKLNPADARGRLIAVIYNLNPAVCRLMLRAKAKFNQHHNGGSFVLDRLH
jgi:glycosyltransferase involved in cell wall biosynthesis